MVKESKQSQFNPYQNNGGTVAAVALGGRVAVGGDTRISVGYNIISRNYCKITQLTSKAVIASSGMVTDAQNLHKLLLARITLYKHQHGTEPSLKALSKLLSITLYSRRFFPFYTFNLLAGLNEEGQGAVYGYDAIGSFDELKYGVQGTGQELCMSVLDNQCKGANRTDDYTFTQDPVELIRDVFTSCAERDIYTGDAVTVWDITAEGIQQTSIPLRRD
ncbi:unnamed protein product [Blepharisma stoltei]|uniref:Proteasome subunit beta n=1 Tax=Blepharisma stoltei TaxID=1481888 RepID=A0AAU9JFU7_9CILI|nr:unnamed protein product [Blepharisma stoltei]